MSVKGMKEDNKDIPTEIVAVGIVSPRHDYKKRKMDGMEGTQGEPSKGIRVLMGQVIDEMNIFDVQTVFGYTKHWFDKDYIKLKRKQVLENLQWWRNTNISIHEEGDELYDEDTLLEPFYEEIMTETTNIENNIEEYDHIVTNILNKEALAALINRKKSDPVVSFLYNLMHFNKMSVYKADWYTGFESVTVFQRDGLLCGELVVEAGKKFKWTNKDWPLDD